MRGAGASLKDWSADWALRSAMSVTGRGHSPYSGTEASLARWMPYIISELLPPFIVPIVIDIENTSNINFGFVSKQQI
jgi:hypothetical protein